MTLLSRGDLTSRGRSASDKPLDHKTLTLPWRCRGGDSKLDLSSVIWNRSNTGEKALRKPPSAKRDSQISGSSAAQLQESNVGSPPSAEPCSITEQLGHVKTARQYLEDAVSHFRLVVAYQSTSSSGCPTFLPLWQT